MLLTATMVINANDPSPTAPRYPTNRASGSLLSCLELVPEATMPWKPETAPQAIVTNNKGTIDGALSPKRSLNAGADMSGINRNTAP